MVTKIRKEYSKGQDNELSVYSMQVDEEIANVQ